MSHSQYNHQCHTVSTTISVTQSVLPSVSHSQCYHQCHTVSTTISVTQSVLPSVSHSQYYHPCHTVSTSISVTQSVLPSVPHSHPPPPPPPPNNILVQSLPLDSIGNQWPIPALLTIRQLEHYPLHYHRFNVSQLIH